MKWTSSAMAREGGSGDSYYIVDINSYITHSMWRTVGNKYQSPYFTWFFPAFGLLPDHFRLHSTLKVVSGTNSGST